MSASPSPRNPLKSSAPVLPRIQSPADLRALNDDELAALAAEIRELIIEAVSRNGGHLASNLGTVELTVALHRVFESPVDQIVWDVGHQAYAHKILTGRADRFDTIRRDGGLSGFPKRSESEHDCFGTGHSSTSISAALGIMEAKRRTGRPGDVIAVIGDGAMTAGLAFEGLNHAGHLRKKLIVVLNDNEMSISPNVGALSKYLSRIMTGPLYNRVKKETKQILEGLPRLGEPMLKMAQRAEDTVKGFFAPGMLFEELGFAYVGPVDGHRLDALIEVFEKVRDFDWPTLVHVITRKGKGYEPAEKSPSFFHGVGAFDIETGETIGRKGAPSYSRVFGEALTELAREDERIVAITAAMTEGTGLDTFARAFPRRFYDVGIAEPHAVTFAAGLAAEGLRPVVAVYSTFLQRGYDQIIHDVALQKLPVLFALDRGGVVGEDGPTHHGVFDLSYLRHIPDLIVMSPKDENELRRMLKTGLVVDGPTAVRFPRGRAQGVPVDEEVRPLPVGRAELLREGEDLLIVAVGQRVPSALEAAERLEAGGIRAGVVNARFIKPLDADLILALASRAGRVLTVEENALQGGFGSAVLELLADAGLSKVRVRRLGIPDRFVEHASQALLLRRLGLDAEGIAEAAREMVGAEAGQETERAARF